MLLWLVLGALGHASGPSTANNAEDSLQQVIFEVVVPREQQASPPKLTVSTTWLGTAHTVPLTDQGHPGDPPGDGIFSATLSGPPVRMLAVTLNNDSRSLAESTELIDHSGVHTFTWALDPQAPGRARRVALALPPRQMERFEAALTAAGLGWTGLLFAGAIWLAVGTNPGSGTRRRRRRGP